MGRLVLDEDQDQIYAMQLSGVHIGKVVKVGTAARLKLKSLHHLRDGRVRTWGHTRTGNGWNYNVTERTQPYDAITTFYKEEEKNAKH